MKKKYGERENRAHLYPFPFLFQTALGAIKKKKGKRKLSPEPEVNNKAKKAAKKNRMEANDSF
jgi:hypothetical protein